MTRRDARRRVIEILFEADQRRLTATGLVDARLAEFAGTAIEGFVRSLVTGVSEHLTEIDEQLATYAHGWPPERMPAVDRAIARLGCYEILFDQSVPSQVVLGEAADLATELSTDRSPDFLSGLLGRLAKVRDTLG